MRFWFSHHKNSNQELPQLLRVRAAPRGSNGETEKIIKKSTKNRFSPISKGISIGLLGIVGILVKKQAGKLNLKKIISHL